MTRNSAFNLNLDHMGKQHVLATLALLGAHVLQVNAWGAAGHEIVGTIAEIYLHPTVLPQICAIVYPYNKEPCHLAPIATWADRIRPFPQWKWAAPFHYVGGLNDWPPSKCIFGADGWEGKDGVNVLGGIWNTTQWLKDGKSGAGEAIKFLVHFLGDLHMPLHLTARERGGNEVKVHFHRRITNLHSVWDSRLISNAILDTPHNYTHPFPSPQIENALRGAIYDPYIRSILWEGLLHTWKDDLEEWISCPAIQYPTSQTPLGLSPAHDVRRWDDEFVCPYHWASPTAALNCNNVTFPPALDWPPSESNETHPAIELDTPAYAGRIRSSRIVEKLLAQGGIRAAAVLNGLFASEEVKQTGGLYLPQ